MTFQKATYFTIGVLVLHGILILIGGYGYWSNVDVLMHFLGGFAMALYGLAIHHAVASKHHTKKSPLWYHYVFVVGFAMLIGVAWEFHEYILDNTVVEWFDWAPTQPSLEDTMMDFLMDWLGASVAFFWKKKEL